MSLFSETSYDYSPTNITSTIRTKDEDNCLICKIMRIQHEKADIVKWVYSSDKSEAEKAKLATSLTGIIFDEDVVACIQDPDIQKFLFSK